VWFSKAACPTGFRIIKYKLTHMKQGEDQKSKGDGTDFVNHQRDMDKARNERRKDQPGQTREEDESVKTDVSQKKTGSGKQVSPGT
jgi:hypothetical protein